MKIEIYTDGACVPNPGEMAIGVVFLYNGHKKELSEKIGPGTNQVAEITAIHIALTSLKRKDIPIKIYTDSQYAVGCLKKDWDCTKNKALISDTKDLISRFGHVDIEWVRGHSGNMHNERADYLSDRLLPEWRYK